MKRARAYFGRLCEGQDGSTIVEMAFVMPVALMFTFGILQLCLYLTCYIGATYISQAAVRYAVVHGSSSASPCSAATLSTQIQPFLIGVPQRNIRVTSAWTPDNNPGSTVSVTIAISYRWTIPFGETSTLKSSATAKGVIVE